jgi:dynein light chain LC8-type
MNLISSDMEITSEMKKDAETKAKDFLGHTEINEADVSKQMKDFFDKKYQPNWHCVVGKNFFSSFSHEEKTYIFFSVGQISVLLYKIG